MQSKISIEVTTKASGVLMTVDNYGFHFEKSGRGAYAGPNDPSGEYFTNIEIEVSLAREMIQNSLDARSTPDTVVRVEFELRSMLSADIPGIEDLRTTISLAIESNAGLQGTEYLDKAALAANAERINVLRVGDYGTRGLTGSESINSPQTPLSTLTRSTGASSNDGSRGGSFGIGSAVGPLASELRTVAYISMPQDSASSVYAATSKLASFKDASGDWHTGTGFYTDLDEPSDFKYPRGKDHLGDFAPRSAIGTDLFVLGYKEAGQDVEMKGIQRAVLDNFLVAIHKGRLEVSATYDGGNWALTSQSVGQIVENDEILSSSLLPFYLALTTGEHVTQDLPRVGEVDLYVHVDADLPKRLGTQLMRSPLMKVQTIQHTFQVPYAAIFICDNERGNKALRQIEPPTHDKWNDKGPRSDQAVVNEIKGFIRDELKKIIPKQMGEATAIKGLARFLPSSSPIEQGARAGTGSGAPSGDETTTETALRLGKSGEPTPHQWTVDTQVALKVSLAADDSESGGTRLKGRKSGGTKKSGRSGKGNAPGLPSPGGPNRIQSTDVAFRSFSNKDDGASTIILRPMSNVEGDLHIAAMGGGDREVFGVSIVDAYMQMPNGKVKLKTDGSAILGLSLTQDVLTELVVRFSNGARYRLGMANG